MRQLRCEQLQSRPMHALCQAERRFLHAVGSTTTHTRDHQGEHRAKPRKLVRTTTRHGHAARQGRKRRRRRLDAKAIQVAYGGRDALIDRLARGPAGRSFAGIGSAILIGCRRLANGVGTIASAFQRQWKANLYAGGIGLAEEVFEAFSLGGTSRSARAFGTSSSRRRGIGAGGRITLESVAIRGSWHGETAVAVTEVVRLFGDGSAIGVFARTTAVNGFGGIVGIGAFGEDRAVANAAARGAYAIASRPISVRWLLDAIRTRRGAGAHGAGDVTRLALFSARAVATNAVDTIATVALRAVGARFSIVSPRQTVILGRRRCVGIRGRRVGAKTRVRTWAFVRTTVRRRIASIGTARGPRRGLGGALAIANEEKLDGNAGGLIGHAIPSKRGAGDRMTAHAVRHDGLTGLFAYLRARNTQLAAFHVAA